MHFRTKQSLLESFLKTEEDGKTYVCQECLEDPSLRRLRPILMAKKVCIACQQTGLNALATERIARYIREYLPKHFEVDEDPIYRQEITLSNVVKIAIRCQNPQVSKTIAEHLENQGAVEDNFYAPGKLYRRIPSPFDSEEHERWYCEGDWNNVAEQLKHGQRFFNAGAREFFEKLIYEALEARAPEQPETPAVIRHVPTDLPIYRARIAKRPDEVHAFTENPKVELSAPPKQFAGNNRMSAAGVPLLYVSTDAKTCIAEVRPSTGDTVVVGRFVSRAPLKLFDFTALSNPLVYASLSLFDPRYEERTGHRCFLRYLHDQISRPVSAPDTDYVATQALTEFIRFDEKNGFDGVVFRSVQNPYGVNFVLFDRSQPYRVQAPGWHPSFNLDISTENVTVHQL